MSECGAGATGAGFEAEGVEGDEASGVVLVVALGGVFFHGGDGFVVEREGAAAACGHDVALVEFEADLAGDVFLGFGDEGLEGVAFRGEPEAVVDEGGVFGDETVAEVHDLAVHGDAFDLAVGGEEDAAAWGFVDAAAFHADEAVFDHVDPAAAVAAAEGVEDLHDAVGREVGEAVFDCERGEAELGEEGVGAVGFEGGAETFIEEEVDVFWLVRGVFGGDAEFVHVAGGGGSGVEPRVFEHACFEADVEEIPVHAVGLFGGSLDGDVVFFGVGDHFGAAWEFGAEVVHAPWGDDDEFGGEHGGAEFEADLVVAFTGGTVGDGVGVFAEGDFDHAFGDAGSGDGGAEEVLAFVDGTGLEHGEDVIAGEFLAEVADEALGGAGGGGFFFEAVEFFFLADVGAVGDDLALVLVFEPGEEDRGIQTAGVRDNDFLHRKWERSTGVGKRNGCADGGANP